MTATHDRGDDPADDPDEIIERFEDAWESGENPQIEAFLPAPGPTWFPVLIELVHVDLERRLRARQPVRIEVYLTRFPAIAANSTARDELLFAEIRIRRSSGEGVTLAEVQQRFPADCARLQAELDQLFASAVPPTAPLPPPATTESSASNTDERAARDVEAPSGNPRLPVIAGYTVDSILGEGGAAIVYLATQHSPRRLVAIKMLHAARGHSEELARRLRAEAEVVAQLQHPNIVQIYEVGQHQGDPFLVMEYLSGGSLQDRLATEPLGFQQAATLVRTLALATEVAHAHGVIHRDLKPSNVLFAADGTPKISDFGLAKQLDSEVALTQTGQILGTPSFMAPEQAVSAHGSVGLLTDVYALGAILYTTVSGRPPFTAASVIETLEQVRKSEPVAPSTLAPKLPRDLETICLKCLEKSPQRRYGSAVALAEDLARFLRNEPILARPTGLFERGVRWCQRNRLPAALGASLLFVFAVGASISMLFAIEATQRAAEAEAERARVVEAQRVSEEQRDLARRNQYFAQMNVAQQAWKTGNVAQCLDILARLAPQEDDTDFRGFEYYRLVKLCHQNSLTLEGHSQSVTSIAEPADGRFLLSGGADGKLLLWDPQSGVLLRQLADNLDAGPGRHIDKGTRGIRAVAVSPDGKLAAAVLLNEIQIWDVSAGEKLHAFKMEPGDCFGVMFSPDGSRLSVLAPINLLRSFESESGKELPTFKPSYFPGNNTALAYSPDGGTMALASGLPVGSSTVRFIDVATNKERTAERLSGHRAIITTLAYSPDGKRLATGSADQTIQIWNLQTKKVELTLTGHHGFVTAVRFSADGQRCYSAGADHTVNVWNLTTGEAIFTLRGHTDLVTGLLLTPDTEKLITSSGDGTIRVWANDIKSYRALNLFSDAKTEKGRVSLFVAALAGNKLRPYLVPSLSLSPNGRELAAIVVGPDGKGTIEVRSTDEQSPEHRVFATEYSAQSLSCCAFSPDGSLLAAGSGSFLNAFVLAFSRGHAIRKASDVLIWDPRSQQLARKLSGHDFEIFSMTFSATAGLLATGDTAGAVNVWKLADGERQSLFAGNKEPAVDVCFSSDARFVASASPFEDVVRVWEVATGKETLLPAAFPTAVAFSPDGTQLAIGSGSFLADRSTAHGEVTILDWRRAEPRVTLRGHTQFVRRIFYTAGGTRLWSIGFDGAARLWDLKTGYEIAQLDGDFRCGLSADLSQDGSRIAIGTDSGQAILWDGAP